MKIERFAGEHRWLSNFAPAEVMLYGMTFPTVEHAYQSAKTNVNDERIAIRDAPSPGAAKRLGKKVQLAPDFDSRKTLVMFDLLRQKFMLGGEYAPLLLATEDAEIVEGNDWGDKFWGVCGGEGENHLGRLIMIVRRRLQSRNAKRPNCVICGAGHGAHNFLAKGHQWRCENCDSEEIYFRNFDKVLREADIHCDGCREYIRMWDPN